MLIDMGVGFILGLALNCLISPMMDKFLNKKTFKIGETVFWKETKEIDENNNKWEVSLNTGVIISSSDDKICIKKLDSQDIVFISTKEIYLYVYELKRSIGAELTLKENLKEEGSFYQIV